MTTTLDADTGATGGRGVPNAWSPGSNGTNWLKIAGSAPTISMVGSELHLTNISAATVWQLGSGTAADAEALVRFRFSSTSDVFGVFLRETASNNYYFTSNTSGVFKLNKNIAGTVSQVGSNFNFSFAANTFYWIRFRVVGTNLYGKIWADGSGEPAAWSITGTDNSIVGAGGWGVRPAPAAVGDTVDFDSYSVLQVFSPNTEAAAKFSTRVSLSGRSTAKFSTRTGLTARTVGRFITALAIRSTTRSKFFTRGSLKTIAVDTFKINNTTMMQLITASSVKFKINMVLLADWFKLVFGSPVSLIKLSFAPTTSPISLSFVETLPIVFKFGDPPLANPNSSIQVSVTAMNSQNVALANLSSLTCIVSFPDGSVSPTYSIGSGIVNSGGGVYVLSYTTKSPGINNELWTATDTLGNTAQYQNRTSVTY